LIKQEELTVDFAVLADKAEAFSCADLENVVRFFVQLCDRVYKNSRDCVD
jgi:hypothetical protein